MSTTPGEGKTPDTLEEVDERATEDQEGVVERVLGILSHSFLLSVAAFGVVLFAIGIVLDGVLSGMFGIWGISAVVAGLLGHTVLYLNRIRYAT